jgi:hypothetical protein
MSELVFGLFDAAEPYFLLGRRRRYQVRIPLDTVILIPDYFSCNWLGGHASILAMDWYGKQQLADTPFTNMTINGTAVAAIQNVDNFSFA